MNVLMINVFVETPETRAPVQGLDYPDFQVFDNGTRLEPVVFESGATETWPAEIWFLVSCPQQGRSSDFATGDASAFKQALTNLGRYSSVGVAHWCANGDADTDLLPTQDREAPLVALEAISHKNPVVPSEASSKRSFQRALDLVIEKSRGQNNQALPVIIALSDGSLGLSKHDSELMAKKLLYRGAILYDVENRHEVSRSQHRKEEGASLQNISRQTGGRTYSVGHQGYFQVINDIMERLRFRYTLGLIPGHVDGQWHTIRVKLTSAALRKHQFVRLDYPTGYLASRFGTTLPYSMENYRRATDSNLDNVLAQVLDRPTVIHDILFDVKGHGFIGSDNLLEFSLQLGRDELTWVKLPNGRRKSGISIVVASYSEDGRNLGHEVIQFDVIRDEAHLPITGDGPLSTSEVVAVSELASRVRVAVRDDATGKVGCQDFSLKEVLSAPRSPMVIM
jgi:hypothetical protein